MHVEVFSKLGLQPKSVGWTYDFICEDGSRHRAHTSDLAPGREWWVLWPENCPEPAKAHIAVFVDWFSCEQQVRTGERFSVRKGDHVRIEVDECEDVEKLLR